MQKLAEICIRRPVFAAMIVLALVVVGAASYFRLGVDRFPSVDLPTVTVRTTLPGLLPRGDRGRDLAEDRGGGQHGRGHRGAALDLLRLHARSSSPPSTSTATSRPPRRTCATASRRSFATLPDGRPSRRSSPSSTTTVAGAVDRAVGQPLAARADRARRQGRQGAARALGRRRRGADRRRPGARDQHLGRRRPAGRLRHPDHRGARGAWRGRTPTSPAATSPPALREQTLRTMGRFDERATSSTIWSWPRSTARRSACATSAAPRTAPRSSARSRA